MGWASGLQAGLQLGRAFKEGQERRAMEKILGATANEIQDYGTSGTQQIQGLQGSGAYDVQAIPGAEGTAPTLRYTPKQGLDLQGDTAPAGAYIDVAPQRMTEYLGQRYEGGLTPERMETIRTRALANAMTDPMRRQQALQNITAEERAQAAELRAQGQYTSQQELTNLSIEEQRRLKKERDATEARQNQLSKDWSDRLATKDADGNVTGMRPPTDEDLMWSAQRNAQNLAAAGKTTEALGAYKDFVITAKAQIEKQGAERGEAIKLAIAKVNDGNFSAARDFYDKFVPDGARVTEFKENKDGSVTVKRVDLDGKPLPDTKTTKAEIIQGLVSFDKPEKLVEYAQQSFMNNLQTQQLKLQQRNTAATEGQLGLAREANKRAEAKEAREANPLQAKVDMFKKVGIELTPAQIESIGGLDKAESPYIKAKLDAIAKSVDPLRPGSAAEAVKAIDALGIETTRLKNAAANNTEIIKGLKAENKAGNLTQLLTYLREEKGMTDSDLAPLLKEAGIKVPKSAAPASASPAAAPTASGIDTSRTGTGEVNPYVTTSGRPTGVTTGAPSVASQVLPQVAQSVENAIGTTAAATRYLQGKISRNEPLSPADTARAIQLGLIKKQ